MARHVAFLGSVNVGGHRVTMDALRAEFAALGFEDVWTFIASGNVVFSASSQVDAAAMSFALEAALGFPVPVYLRRDDEVIAAAALVPFSVADGDTHLVAFYAAPLSAAAERAVCGLGGPVDAFVVDGADVHWRVHGSSMDSLVKASALALAAGGPCTTRNTTSLRKLAAKLAA